MCRRAIAVLVCALAFALPALAQEQRGSLEGTIKDAQGAVLPGAVVEARSAALIGVRSAPRTQMAISASRRCPPARIR